MGGATSKSISSSSRETRKPEGRSPQTRNAGAEVHLHAPAPVQASMVAEWLQIEGVSFAHNNRPQCPRVYKPLYVESSKVSAWDESMN